MLNAAKRYSTPDRFVHRTRTRKNILRQTRRIKPKAQMWWASRPWLGRLGRLGIYRCVGLVENNLYVGVATALGFSWVDADLALTPAEAAIWAGQRR